MSLNGEDDLVQKNFAVHSFEPLSNYIGNTSLLIIDEAQKIPRVGHLLKFIVDSMENLKVMVTGSAAFSLAQKVGEPLTGRQKVFRLFPIAAQEIIEDKDRFHFKATLPQRLIFGSYPELFSIPSQTEQVRYLKDLIETYLFKDILEIEQVKDPKKLRDLLTLLAFQIGHEVSLTELGNQLDLHKDTVSRYLDLLEKAFVIVNIRGFSRNLRKEVTKSSRYYFYDNGIRNALINNFNPLSLRNDAGMLWENYLIMERLKHQSYSRPLSNNYFWRTYDQKELDWVEEREGKLFGYEIKWGKKSPKAPKGWLETYSNAEYLCVNQENFLDFIAPQA